MTTSTAAMFLFYQLYYKPMKDRAVYITYVGSDVFVLIGLVLMSLLLANVDQETVGTLCIAAFSGSLLFHILFAVTLIIATATQFYRRIRKCLRRRKNQAINPDVSPTLDDKKTEVRPSLKKRKRPHYSSLQKSKPINNPNFVLNETQPEVQTTIEDSK
jgi:hypothetical protein